MSIQLPASGDIRQFDLIQILRELHEHKASGSLIFRNSKAIKCIYLKEGEIVFAASNLPEDRLGEVLLRLGKISPEQLQHSVEQLKETGKKLGAILVASGYLTAKELFDGLKDQVREIIYGLSQWEDGEYLFMEQELPEKAIPLQMDLVQLITDILKETLKRVQA